MEFWFCFLSIKNVMQVWVSFFDWLRGRMKLLATHVYPKNKYLTLQMTRSANGVVCEDVFESLVQCLNCHSKLSFTWMRFWEYSDYIQSN